MSALGLAARTFHGTFVSNLRNQVRYYTLSGWMISTVLSPVFLLAGAAVVARFLAGDGSPAYFVTLTGYPSYLSFVVLGLAANGLVLSALEDGGTAVHGEESEGTWDLLALTPMNRFVWMNAKMLAGLLTSFVDFVVVLALGALAFDLAIVPEGLPVALVGLALTILGLQGFGFLMAAIGLVWKEPYALVILLSPLLIFVSGMMFPVAALPAWVQTVSYAFPLTHGLVVVRDALLLGRGFEDLTGAFAWLVGTGAAFMAVGYTAFHFMERRARTKGVMGRY